MKQSKQLIASAGYTFQVFGGLFPTQNLGRNLNERIAAQCLLKQR